MIARRILEGRPYRSVDAMERVKGIGEQRLAQLPHRTSRFPLFRRSPPDLAVSTRTVHRWLNAYLEGGVEA